MNNLLNRIQTIVEPIIENHGSELVDLEYVREGNSWFLRIYADKPDGITINDCAQISESVGVALDAMDPDPFPKEYFLEVSSPGAERPLRTPEEIAAAVGKYVHFDYYAHQHGQTFHEGDLLEITDNGYVLKINDKGRFREIVIDPSGISKARLAVKF